MKISIIHQLGFGMKKEIVPEIIHN